MGLRWCLALMMIWGLSVGVSAQDAVTAEIVRLANQERARIGAPPLTSNPLLVQAAQRHSDDMAATETMSHLGSDNSQFWERIQATGYTLATGGENVLYRFDRDAAAAYQQWYNSQGHRENMLNPDYLEVGVAYAQGADGAYYFTMVLATQPGATPPTSAPVVNTPPATNTPPPTAIPPSPTVRPTDIALATVIAPLPTNTSPPNVAITIPTSTPTETVAPDIRLTYDDRTLNLLNVSGRSLDISTLIFESDVGTMPAELWDNEYLTQPLYDFTAGDCVQVWGLETAFISKADDCQIRHAWIVVNERATFWRDAERFIVRDGTTPVGVCDVAQGACDINLSTTVAVPATTDSSSASTATPDLRLIYDTRSFALVNVSGRALNLTGIRFTSESGDLPIENWDNGYLSQPLDRFTAGDCLQAWGTEITGQLPAPASCNIRHAWMITNDSRDFWRDATSFTVARDGTRLATCDVRQGICNVSLTANFGQVQSPAVANTTTPQDNQATADMRLLLSQTGFTLMNTSGRTLDLTGLAFESDGGVFVASRWNIPALSRPLNAFPAGDCLQVWQVNGSYGDVPADCQTRHAWVAVAADSQFWLNANVFRVRQGATVLATCETRAPFCNFDLP
jgi:hypothetical protein